MRKIIRCVAAMMCAMGIAGEVAAAEKKARPDPVMHAKMGICEPIANMPGVAPNLGNVLIPIGQAGIYFGLYEHQNIDRSTYAAATVSLLQNPKHGVMRLVTEADRGTLFSQSSGLFDPTNVAYAYLPEQGYLGNDSATFLVDIGGKTVKLVYFLRVVDRPVGNDGDLEICKNGPYWKISSTLDNSGNSSNSAISSIEYVSPASSTPDTLTSDSFSAWLSFAQLDAKVADMSGLMSSLNVGASTDS